MTKTWQQFLSAWEARLSRSNANGCPPDRFRDMFIADRKITYPGASKRELSTCERRLGCRLPPSYREFLAASNGLLLLTWSSNTRLLSTSEVCWFVDVAPRICEVWSQEVPGRPQHKIYGSRQNWMRYDSTHVSSLLLISDMNAGADYFLLDPLEEATDGEWETWQLMPKAPGIQRFRTFEDMMQKMARNKG